MINFVAEHVKAFIYALNLTLKNLDSPKDKEMECGKETSLCIAGQPNLQKVYG